MNSGDFDNTAQLSVLIERVIADDAEAFDELAVRASQRLRGLAQAMLRKYPQVKRWEDTDDILQATLLRLHRSLKEVKPKSTRDFYGLAVTQIRRSLIDLVRHYHGPHGHGAHHHSRGGGRAADDSGGYLADAASRGEEPGTLDQWAVFHEAIDDLPPDEREVFALIWYGGLKRKDVAEMLSVAEKTVLRRFTRARLKLHESLHGQSPGSDSP